MRRTVWLVALVLVMSVIPLVGVAAAGGFTDTDGSVFKADIDWLAAEGITKGCNPPTNNKYCPNGQVTRGQMAAFLVRALKLPATSTDFFTDDAGSTFENDINRLAASGITKGCNPPNNTSYCPNGLVTRGQMAAFLGRAYHLPSTPDQPFKDTATTIFKADIDRLATSGITKGCNPPTNNMYCPSGVVTRGQMAAFLHRAARPVVPPPTTPPPTTPPPPAGDTTKPVIVVIGANTVNVTIGVPYLDKGATATDNVDGDITGKIDKVDKVDWLKLGTYVVTYDVMDVANNEAIQKTRTVNVVPLGTATQTNHFLTGYEGPDLTSDQLTVPSIDPAGITYGPSNHLFIVDSEMNEEDVSEVWTDLGGKNVFEVSLDGLTLHNTYALPGPDQAQQEPTGIAYDATDDVFYVTNDVTKKLYSYQLTGGGFSPLHSVSTEAIGFKDVEGVTVDSSGNIYVIAETKKTILVYTYDTAGGFAFVRAMDLATLNHPDARLPRSPEGIAFDVESGNLFLVSQWDKPKAIFEYTTTGVLVDRYTIKGFSALPAFGTDQHNLTIPKAPHGITFGPATSGPSRAFYLADGGVDNGSGELVFDDQLPPVLVPELERDGVIYEGQLP